MKRPYLQTGPQAMAQAAWGAMYETAAPKAFEVKGDAGIIEIEGPLCEHKNPFWQSYEALEEIAQDAFTSPEVKQVVLSINSQGGDAAGCIELSRTFRRLSEETGKPLTTYVRGCMASAAYALGCAAQQIICPATATVGSIGVFEPIADVTEQDRMMGVKFTFVTSGKLKLAGNPHIPTNKDHLASIGRQVEELSGLFFDLVSEMRGVSRDEIAALEGEAFIGAQALNNSLVDGVEQYAGLLARLSEGTPSMPAQAAAKKSEGLEEAMKSLIAMAESDDEDTSKKAKRMLRAYAEDEGGEDGKEEPKKEEGSKAEGKEDEKKEAKAEGKDEEKKEGEATKAMATLTSRLHAMEVERATEKETRAKAALLDTRKDFSPEVRSTLEALPLATVEKAVKEWKRAPGSHAAASMTMPTVIGDSQGDVSSHLPSDQQAAIEKAFGRRPVITTETIAGTSDRSAARAYLDKLEKARAQISTNGVK